LRVERILAPLLGVIPARGDSKAIPRKNVKPFLGRPLLVWTVEAARESGVLDRLVVSTEDEEIAGVARGCGAEVVERPAELASDETPTAPVVRHALEALGHDPAGVLVLEPTSPARRPEHVREAAALLAGADSVASVSEVPHHYAAAKQLRVGADGTLAGLDGTHPGELRHRRQELEVVYAFNGLVFGCRAELARRDPPTLWGERVVAHVVEPRFALDLDRPEDWPAAEARMRELLAELDVPASA
jgi:N-acylneuraminate cytidylyltransferase